MTGTLPVFAEGSPAPELAVVPPELPAALTTAMVLVDYALAGTATPTPEPLAVARDLPADLVTASHPVRAVLAHGTVLRDLLGAEPPPGHAGRTGWPPLRDWIARWDDARVRRVVADGVAACLAYRQPPGSTPTAAEVGASAAVLREYVTRVLRGWPVPDPAGRARELLDPGRVRATLLALLDAIWDGWVRDAWTAQLPRLRAAVERSPRPPAGCSGAQWVRLVTGLRPDPQFATAADAATRLVLMPCIGLGRSLSSFLPAGGGTGILYTPVHAPDPDPAPEPAAEPVALLDPLAPVLHALGDRTRLAVVLHLIDRGPLWMSQLTAALRVHQSTISRQVGALRRAGLVTVDGQRRIAVERDAVRTAGQTLLDALR